ncbi:adenylate cyclase type 2-like [Penaeus japonicus]|uniref:adenylate cyclase type 2-like n=1 Tax=Penaeus japonicus TaxID=27405 RepID=UPI001C70DA36|nr:adenylate cyclase type 2-like [Penaeus japonicus]
MELKNVYERYQARLRNSAFLGVVTIGALASCCLLGATLHGAQDYDWSPAAVILCCYIGFLLLIIGMAQQVFAANIGAISALIATTFWLITTSILVSVGILHQPRSPAHLTPPAFLLVLITHTTVPLRRAHTRVLAGISTLLPLVTLLASPELTWGVRQVVGYALMMLAANTLGWWLEWEAAQALESARTSSHELIDSRVNLECERDRQEQLLQSVIPAYIAEEVKRHMMPRQTGPPRKQFRDLYVQRHNNVSILYADIVNFTPLSEQLSASDLVTTLNNLFGSFDQIAQVRNFTLREVLYGDTCIRQHRKIFVNINIYSSMYSCIYRRESESTQT